MSAVCAGFEAKPAHFPLLLDTRAQVGKMQEIRGSAQTVTIKYRGREFQVPKGALLRTAMLKNGVTPHNDASTLISCRGLGTCGTCAVEIEGAVEPPQQTLREVARLNFPPHSAPGSARLRLACQTRCMSDCTVIKRDGFWGQGEEVLGEVTDDEFKTWFGELEFLLDPGSNEVQDQREKQ